MNTQSNYIEKITPHNVQSERSILGCMILNKNILNDAVAQLSPENFYFKETQILFKVISEIHLSNKPVDLIILFDSLQNKNLLDDIGGYEFLVDLTNNSITANYLNYIQIIKNCSIRRQLIEVCNELTMSAYDMNLETKDLIEYAESTIFTLDQNRYSQQLEQMSDTFYSLENKLINYIQSGGMTENDHKKLISTGMSDLDFYLNGGFQNGGLYILAARPAMGKSGLGINLATNISIRQTRPVAIFSLEMLKNQIAERIISSEFGRGIHEFKTGKVLESDIPKFQKVMQVLKDSPMYVYDKGSVSTLDIKNNIRKLKTEKGEVGLVVVDYLQLLDSKGHNRNDEVSKIARDLKNIALELQVPVLALSQLNREVEGQKSKVPSLSHLRDSGEIEQAADVVMMIYRDEYYNPDSTKTRQADVIIAKNRAGSVGTVNLYFDAVLTKFAGLEKLN